MTWTRTISLSFGNWRRFHQRCVLQLTNMSRIQVLVQMIEPDTHSVSASGAGAIKFCILPDGTFDNIGNSWKLSS